MFIVHVIFFVAIMANAVQSDKIKCNGEHEQWNSCASCIPQDCYPEKYTNIACTAVCREACECIPGYVRGGDGKCMPKDKCPPKCTGKYEVWNNCSTCIPQDCYPEKYYTIRCAPVCRCDCIEGYVRGEDGKCMPKEKCPPKCNGPYEYWNECAGCIPQDCYPEKYKDIFCPAVCSKRCDCIKGYVRGDDGKCMPKDKCPPKVCKGKNEEYVKCPGCSPQTCITRDRVYKCPVSNCTGACRCIKDHFRDNDLKCVSRKQCEALEKCPKGEVYSPCPTVRCDADFCPLTQDYQRRCPTGIVCDPPRCVCKANWVRDRDTKICKPIADCKPFPCKGINQIYEKCPSRCQLLTCDDLRNNVKCIESKDEDKRVCWPACVCKKGTYKDQNNQCVHPKSCLLPVDY